MNKKRIVYFDCFSGISGDMILGALVDIGIDLDYIRQGLQGLGLKGYKIKPLRVKRNGISGTKVNVVTDISAKNHRHRSFNDIKNLISKSRLSKKVKTDSIEIFHRMGKAEAQVHRTTLNKIHFHEVGSLDSIVDIVGGTLGINLLNVDKIFSSPLNVGEGTVKCEHGILPVPAPATLKLLKGIPCYSNGTKRELTTPTGAALIGYYANEFISMPNMHILSAGYGAGSHNIKEIPNHLRMILGEIKDPLKPNQMKIIETNIDDMNPEFYECVMDQLFEIGVADVFFTPVYMKKNRPGTLLSVLVSPESYDSAIHVILKETSTFGVRSYDVNRTILTRREEIIKTSFGKVRVKIGLLDGSVLRTSPEYEDCKKLSQKKNIPIKKIYDEALNLAEKLQK